MGPIMLSDTSCPPIDLPLKATIRRRDDVAWQSTSWTPESLGQLAGHLARSTVLAKLPPHRLFEVWSATIEEFLDRSSPTREALDAPLAALCGLSPAGLAAGLTAVLGGVRGEPAEQLFHDAQQLPDRGSGLVVVILASNIPALALQPLLPALALRRPVLLKSASAEPLFAPAFVTALCRREPRLRPALAAVTWPGGERPLEQRVLAAAGKIVAYGGGEVMRDLDERVDDKLVAYGPKISIAVVAAGSETPTVADGLARDVALFDQRGCLSVQAIFTDGDPTALARAVGEALGQRAEVWPMGEVDPRIAAEVRQIRAEAEMRPLFLAELPLGEGTVVVEDEPILRPSPGLRTVRIYPLDDLGQLPEVLRSWQGRLQGVALSGEAAWSLEPALRALGVSRFSPPGELQYPDATWHNGGISPLGSLVA
ncbi:MAG: hypothetical protein GY856_39595 [bacterium]|nr:hypothetical protein [bacterium]